jgi:hypothetical protein
LWLQRFRKRWRLGLGTLPIAEEIRQHSDQKEDANAEQEPAHEAATFHFVVRKSFGVGCALEFEVGRVTSMTTTARSGGKSMSLGYPESGLAGELFAGDGGWRIVATGMEWMAAQQSLERQPGARQDAVVLEALRGVAGAGWLETAAWAKQWRQGQLIDPDQHQQQLGHDSGRSLRRLAAGRQPRLANFSVTSGTHDPLPQSWLQVSKLG